MRAAALGLVLAACSTHVHVPAAAAPATPPLDIIAYEARLDDRYVEAEARVPAGAGTLVSADAAMLPYFRDVEIEQAGAWARLEPALGPWRVPACARGCRLRWKLAIAAAGRDLDDHDYVARFDAAWLAPPGSFLLRLEEAPKAWRFRLHVDKPAAMSFVTGVLPARDLDHRRIANTYEADLGSLADLPYTAFGRFRTQRLQLADAELEVAIVGPALAVGDARLFEWILTAAGTIRRTFGRFPLARAAILILVEDGGEIGEALTMGNGGGSSMLRVGRSTPTEAFASDWKMTHEMLHLSLPNVPQRWVEEGLATYVEPFARARDGLLDERRLWHETLRGLPFGLPRPGEGGLDETPTWGRTYWGGALFFLLADLDIREKTHDQRSLDDALRAIARAGGNASVRWSLQRFLEVGDQATGTRSLHEAYEHMGPRVAVPAVDLPALMKRLGVESHYGHVTFDDSAPLAPLRRALTAHR